MSEPELLAEYVTLPGPVLVDTLDLLDALFEQLDISIYTQQDWQRWRETYQRLIAVLAQSS